MCMYGIHHPKLGYLWFDSIVDAAEFWNNAQSLSVWQKTPFGWVEIDVATLEDVLRSKDIELKPASFFDRFNREPA